MKSIYGMSLSRRRFITFGLGSVGALLTAAVLCPATALGAPENDEIEITVTHDPAESFFNGITPYSWFGSTLYFGGPEDITMLDGEVRSYDGTNVGIEMTCSKSMGTTCDDYFSVELWRGKPGSGTYVGSAGFAREGFTKATWSNVGSGDYAFRFVKCPDTQVIQSSDVAMYSW